MIQQVTLFQDNPGDLNYKTIEPNIKMEIRFDKMTSDELVDLFREATDFLRSAGIKHVDIAKQTGIDHNRYRNIRAKGSPHLVPGLDEIEALLTVYEKRLSPFTEKLKAKLNQPTELEKMKARIDESIESFGEEIKKAVRASEKIDDYQKEIEELKKWVSVERPALMERLARLELELEHERKLKQQQEE